MATLPAFSTPCNGTTYPVVIPQGAPAFLPEAPCSITLRVPMPGYADQALVTGRGATGAEAAAQWQASRDALLAVLAPPPAPIPPTREEVLSRLLTCGTLKAVKRGDFALVQRLTKAFVLVVKGMIECTEREGAYAVRSERDMNLWYTVEGMTCSCPDSQRHRGDEHTHCCKHVLCKLMYERAEQEAAPGA